MTLSARDVPRGDCLSPTDPRLLDSPLDFIAEDHLREREICALMDRIAAAANGDADTEAATNILAFLRNELPLHLKDEEEDLFPLMQARCDPDDQIDTVIERLLRDHQHALSDTRAVVAILEARIGSADDLSAADRRALTDFAAHARRHLILENAIILPIARARLSADDMAGLTAPMRRRRGLDTAGKSAQQGARGVRRMPNLEVTMSHSALAGQPAPDFSLPRDGGQTVTLGDFAGSKLVIFFYPKADTSGCTREALDFSGMLEDFHATGAQVIGVSKDPVGKQEAFRDKHELKMPLLSDADGDMCERYGVWVEKSMYGRKYMGIARTTLLVGADGTILTRWDKVKVPGHAEAVLAATKAA